MEPLFHFALGLLSAGVPWLAAIIVVAIALAHRGTGQAEPSVSGTVPAGGA